VSMKINRTWAIQSFMVCFFFNSVLAGLIYFMSGKILAGMAERISPFLKAGAPALPEEVHAALGIIAASITGLHAYLAPALAALVGAATLLLWLSIFFIGRRLLARSERGI